LAGINSAVATDIREILEKFRGGAEEEAFFELLEMPGDVLSALTAAFRTEQDPALRAFLVKVAWQRRDPMAVHLLTEALDQTDEEIWQAALDGLVTFASPEALAVLIAARTRELADESATKRFRSFVSEAIEYIRQSMPR
jgi:HEAT repeats